MQVCPLPFPSRAVLEHHLMGSRHARKVKAETVLRQLQVTAVCSDGNNQSYVLVYEHFVCLVMNM